MKFMSFFLAASTFPHDVIFEAISMFFSDKRTTEKLKDKYRELTDQNSATNCTPSIDGEDAQPVTRQVALHSYHLLFCRICYRYDCFIHGWYVLHCRVLF